MSACRRRRPPTSTPGHRHHRASKGSGPRKSTRAADSVSARAASRHRLARASRDASVITADLRSPAGRRRCASFLRVCRTYAVSHPRPSGASLEVLGYAADGAHRRPRGRCAPELRQDGAGHRGARGASGRGPARRPYRAALRRPDVGRDAVGPRVPRARRLPGRRIRLPRRADGARSRGVRARPARGAARPRVRRRRRQLDARRGAGCGQARHPGGARRGRPALLRLDDARGDQPRPHRPAVRPPVHPQPRGRDEPRRRGHRRAPGSLRRQHDDRLAAPLRATRRGAPAVAKRLELPAAASTCS